METLGQNSPIDRKKERADRVGDLRNLLTKLGGGN